MTKILVVDDDLTSVKLIGLMLERRGYIILAAQSGAQALEKAQSDDPDLVILDVMMPDMDGYEVCRRIRSSPTTADLPVIMFTAKTEVDDKVTGFQAGADDYLTKPVHPQELASRVEAVLLRSARRQTGKSPIVRARTFGFLGSKGGVGTTTLAVNVAVVLAQGAGAGNETILAEMRSGMAAASFQLRLRRVGGIARLFEQPLERITPSLVEAQLEEHSSGALVLSGQTEPLGSAVSASPAHAEVIVQHLGAMADYLLLDLGVGLDPVNLCLLPHCERVVVVIEPQRASLVLAQTLLGVMSDSLNLPRHRICLVLVNKAPSAASFTKETIEDLLQHDLGGVITPAPELAFQSGEQGTPMVMAQPNSLVAQQFRIFVDHLVGA